MGAPNSITEKPAVPGDKPSVHLEKAFVARQPIYSDDVNVIAYELLFRNNDLNHEVFASGDQGTAQVLLDTFMEIGLDRVIGQSLAFVSVTRNFLLSDYCSLLPKERVVLQLPHDTIPDAPLLDSISKLAQEGYLIALDNFRYSEWLRPLVALTDIVKLDVQALDRETIRKHVELLRPFELRLLAKKVESHEDYEYCKSLGFDYYQGSFICKPQTVSGDKIPANRMAAMRLLAKLQNPDITTDELEETVSQDVALSYKLIRYANSALHALPKEVSSIRHAIVLVGTRRISNWAGLVLYGQMEEKPSELMTTAIVRARMCQQLALATNQKNAEQFFTVGLFSVLDALLDRPMKDALELLPLAQELKAALIDHQGLVGAALHCVMAYEQGDWDQAQCGGIPAETIYDSYVNALEWTRRTMQELGLELDLKPHESIRRRSEAKLKLQKFADEQEQKVKQAEEVARKNVTRDLLARFDVEFQKLSMEYEERQQQAIAESERARESLKRDFDSATQQWEAERRQLREEITANQAVQVKKEELAELEARLSAMTLEKAGLEEERRQAESRWTTEWSSLKSEMEQLKSDFESRRLEAITAAEAAAQLRFQEALGETKQEFERREQEIQATTNQLSEQFDAERRELNNTIAKLQHDVANSAAVQPGSPISADPNIEGQRFGKSMIVVSDEKREVTEVRAAEISRIEPLIEKLSEKIDCTTTDLAEQIRLNRERSFMEAYLKGLLYSAGEATFEVNF